MQHHLMSATCHLQHQQHVHLQRVSSGRACSTSSPAWCPFSAPVPLPLCGHSRKARGFLLHVCASSRREQQQRSKQNVATFPSTLPAQLLPSDFAEREQPKPSVPLTVYSCRFSTGHGRGAALSNPQGSAVNLCLIGKDGRTVMHRVSPVNDPQQARKEVERMCEIIGNDDVGADCPLALGQALQTPPNTSSTSSSSSSTSSSSSGSYSLPPKPPPAPRLRFQEGMVDEVVFLAPELGPLAGVLVGTEAAVWVLDELQISSSRTHHMDRFICRKLLGSQPGQGAMFLTPVPQGSVVYGTGEGQVTLTREQASALHSLNMDAYAALKQRLITTTVILTISGASVAGLAAGLEGAVPFALGGLAGVVYQWLLQQGVDGIVATTSTSDSSDSSSSSGAAGVTKPSSQQPPRPEMRGLERSLRGTATIDDPTVFIDFVEVDTEGTIIMQQQAGKAGKGWRQGGGDMGALFRGSGLGQDGHHVGRNLMGSPVVRLAFVAAATALVLTFLAGGGAGSGPLPDSSSFMSPFQALPAVRRDQLWQLVVGLLGFMTYKVALVSVSLSAPPPPDLVKARNLKTASGGQRHM